MMHDFDFAYAQARIQARYARLPTQTEWQRLAASRTLASYLEEARTGPLRDWVKGFSGLSEVRDLDAGIRSLQREVLDAVSGWVPSAWREAVSWVRWLGLLPLLAHLQAGGAAPGWVARDPELRALIGAGGVLNKRLLDKKGAPCLLQPEEGLVAAWLSQWQRRWPRCSREATEHLQGLAVLLRVHNEAFPQVPTDSAWRLRAELRETLRLRFHRHTLQPVVPFLYLALTALDLERLRAALVSRLLFPAQEDAAGQGMHEGNAA